MECGSLVCSLQYLFPGMSDRILDLPELCFSPRVQTEARAKKSNMILWLVLGNNSP